MTQITVICQEDGYPEVLIYTVEVDKPFDQAEVKAAIEVERRRDLGSKDAYEMFPLFAFKGDLETCADWRD